MSVIWTKNGPFQRIEYEGEAEFEAAILQVQGELFGRNRIYLDVKKKIGAKGGIQNIPDGYLLDLSGRTPGLYVVENELASHDPLKHIAVQILEFSMSFEAERPTVKKILLNALEAQPVAKAMCEAYVAAQAYRNLDHLLEALIYDKEFAALVIIDEASEELMDALIKRFKFSVDVLELAQYENQKGERLYHFEPFFEDLPDDETQRTQGDQESRRIDISEIDTVVVPARREGFERVFLGENRWYKIRIHGAMRPRLKHVAAYQVKPVSAITHVAPIQSIEPWEDSGKFVVNFSEPAREITPIKLVKGGRVKQLQRSRYANLRRIQSAKTLDDVF